MEKNNSKDLRRLTRRELLELLVEQGQELERIRDERDRLKTELENREIKIANAGSIAEAALSLSGIFEAAQKAADEYLSSVKQAAGKEPEEGLSPELMAKIMAEKPEGSEEDAPQETTVVTETTELGKDLLAAGRGKAPVQTAVEDRVETLSAIHPAEPAGRQKPQQRPVRQQPTHVQQKRMEKQEQARQEQTWQEPVKHKAQQKQAAYASAQFMERQPTGPIDRRETAMPAQQRPPRKVREEDAFPIETYADGDGDGFDFLEI